MSVRAVCREFLGIGEATLVASAGLPDVRAVCVRLMNFRSAALSAGDADEDVKASVAWEFLSQVQRAFSARGDFGAEARATKYTALRPELLKVFDRMCDLHRQVEDILAVRAVELGSREKQYVDILSRRYRDGWALTLPESAQADDGPVRVTFGDAEAPDREGGDA